MEMRQLLDDPQLFYKILPNGAVALDGERIQCVINKKLPDGSLIKGGITRNGEVFGSRIRNLGGERVEYQLLWGGQLGVEELSDPVRDDAEVSEDAAEKHREIMQRRIREAKERLRAKQDPSSVAEREIAPRRSETADPAPLPPDVAAVVKEVLQVAQEVTDENVKLQQDNEELRARVAILEKQLANLNDLDLPEIDIIE